jgi:uncharacterized membrane protein YphA (DoxX/SURF4 family)
VIGIVQRLFSNFADGWPGGALLVQRLLAGGTLLYCGIACLSATPACPAFVTQSIGALAGLLLIAGLWTPVAGAVTAVIEASIAFSSPSNAGIPVILAVLGGTLAMIGPGTWSIDAWVFGRKHIVPPDL